MNEIADGVRMATGEFGRSDSDAKKMVMGV